MRLPVPVDTAVLLAAGRGSRLSPWTDRVPKPLLVHRGRPTLDLVLDSLALAGVSRVVLVTHHLAEQFEPYATQRTAATWRAQDRSVPQMPQERRKELLQRWHRDVVRTLSR